MIFKFSFNDYIVDEANYGHFDELVEWNNSAEYAKADLNTKRDQIMFGGLLFIFDSYVSATSVWLNVLSR